MRLVFSDRPSFRDLGWFGWLLVAVALAVLGAMVWGLLWLFG